MCAQGMTLLATSVVLQLFRFAAADDWGGTGACADGSGCCGPINAALDSRTGCPADYHRGFRPCCKNTCGCDSASQLCTYCCHDNGPDCLRDSSTYMSIQQLRAAEVSLPPSPRPQANEVSGSDGTACTNTCKGPGCFGPSSANCGGLSFSATCPPGCRAVTMDYANDGECDDGGPGSFLAIEHDTWCW